MIAPLHSSRFSRGRQSVSSDPDITAAAWQTDLANAKRFTRRHKKQARYCHPWHKWLIWDGKRWKPDETARVFRLARRVAEDVMREASETRDAGAVKFAVNTASKRGLTALVDLAASDLPILPQQLDQHPCLLNVRNGTLDLRTGELRRHRPDDWLTQLCPVAYDPDAACPRWERFLQEIFPGQPTIASFVQRLLGYCLTGQVTEQAMPIFFGTGSNGKSMLLNTYRSILGDYAMQAIPEMLMAKRNESHPTERADLFRKRFVSAAETECSRPLAEALVKQLTGGENIRARGMHKDFFEFAPTHKLVLATNHKPHIRGTDEGIWRRLPLVPFVAKFQGPARDKNLDKKLLAEKEGILAWAVRGCLDWQRQGLSVPAEVRAATAEYRHEQDVLGRFISECCLVDDGAQVKFSTLFESLETWAKDCGETVPAKRKATAYLRERGYPEKANNGLWFEGIGLLNGTTERTE